MVKLTDVREKLTFELPSFPGSEVVVNKSLLVYQQKELLRKYPNMSDMKHEDSLDGTLATIVMSIVKWNFTDENNKPLPIAIETLEKLPSIDFEFLTEQVLSKDFDEKKNSEKNGSDEKNQK